MPNGIPYCSGAIKCSSFILYKAPFVQRKTGVTYLNILYHSSGFFFFFLHLPCTVQWKLGNGKGGSVNPQLAWQARNTTRILYCGIPSPPLQELIAVYTSSSESDTSSKKSHSNLISGLNKSRKYVWGIVFDHWRINIHHSSYILKDNIFRAKELHQL